MFLRFLLGNIMELIIINCNFFCIILLTECSIILTFWISFLRLRSRDNLYICMSEGGQCPAILCFYALFLSLARYLQINEASE